MIGFMIKKAFFDMWDNMLPMVLMNLGFLVLGACFIYVPSLLIFNTFLSMAGLAVCIILINIYAGAVSYAVGRFADYQTVSFKDFFSYFKETITSSLTLGVTVALEIIILAVTFPFYFNMGGFLGLGAMALIFWMAVIWTFAIQYFFAVRSRLDKSIKKIFKKCFILFFDNTLLSIGLGIGAVIILTISLLTAFILPGPASLLLWYQVALKLRLYKYDYLEENPEADKRKIPWAALLIEDKDKVGPRSLRGMFFPWKD